MVRTLRPRAAPPTGRSTPPPFRRVIALVVALEHYSRNQLPVVDYAQSDARAFAQTIREAYSDLGDDNIITEVITDQDASLVGLSELVRYNIKTLLSAIFLFFIMLAMAFMVAAAID